MTIYNHNSYSLRFSASGRTEISGKHTDHYHGCVLAASLNLKTTAVIRLWDRRIIHVQSKDYLSLEVDIRD